MAKARMGVIGAGWWATQFHIPSLKTYEKADLVGIADIKPEKAAAAADYYDISNTYDDHRDLLAAGGRRRRHSGPARLPLRGCPRRIGRGRARAR